MKILIFLLGSHIAQLLSDRVSAAVDFAIATHQNDTVSWYVSGGTAKNGSVKSEAELMTDIIAENNANGTYAWDYIHDMRATNTAENFIIAKRNVDFRNYDGVFVATSKFHYERAKLIADTAVPSNEFQWILSELEMNDSRYWETIHIRNVYEDVRNAFLRAV